MGRVQEMGAHKRGVGVMGAHKRAVVVMMFLVGLDYGSRPSTFQY